MTTPREIVDELIHRLVPDRNVEAQADRGLGGARRSYPMATGRPATARSRAVTPAQPGVGAAAAGE